jgi:hypothetical protein
MILNEIDINYKVVYHMEIYKFGLGHVSIRASNNLKNKFQNMRTSNGFGIVNDFKWRRPQLQWKDLDVV